MTTSFVYVAYIDTTPESLWNALTDAEMTKQYWARHRNASDWIAGSTWEHRDYDDAAIVHIVGEVVENTPPRRLVLTWGFPADEKRSRVSFEIEPFMDAVRLTVTHDGLEPECSMLHDITDGWPIVISSLKTLLETGQPLAMTTRRWSGPPA